MGHLAAIRRLFLCFGALRSCQDNQSELQQECVVTGYPRQIRHKIISVSQPRLKGDASQCLLFSFLTRSFPDYRVMISIITLSGKTTRAHIIIYSPPMRHPKGACRGPLWLEARKRRLCTFSEYPWFYLPASDGGVSAHREVGPLYIFALHPVRVIL